MSESACPLAHSDAAYVLGSLSPTDRLEFERHLPDCDRCRRSVAELAGLPGLLGRVPREQVESAAPFRTAARDRCCPPWWPPYAASSAARPSWSRSARPPRSPPWPWA